MTTSTAAARPARILRQMAADMRKRSFRKARRERIAAKHSFLFLA